VATAHGSQAIETLRTGEVVLSENPVSGTVEAEPVQAVIADPASPLVAVDLSNGSTITTTATHDFWVDAGVGLPHPEWQYAEHLRRGDRLRTADGQAAYVARVRMGVGTAPVYTLTVAHDHTFFVGASRVLVHNTQCRVKPQVNDTKLANVVGNIFDHGGTVGDGSTMAAINNEVRTGLPTTGHWHFIKGSDTVRGLENWLRDNPNADPSDISTTQSLLQDLKDAFNGKYTG